MKTVTPRCDQDVIYYEYCKPDKYYLACRDNRYYFLVEYNNNYLWYDLVNIGCRWALFNSFTDAIGEIGNFDAMYQFDTIQELMESFLKYSVKV